MYNYHMPHEGKFLRLVQKVTGSSGSPDRSKDQGSSSGVDAFRATIDRLIAEGRANFEQNKPVAPTDLSKASRRIYDQRALQESPVGGLLGVNTKELVEADTKMWQRINNLKTGGPGIVTLEDFVFYEKGAKASLNDSRIIFAKYLRKLYEELWQ